jgi:hypothetical protein
MMLMKIRFCDLLFMMLLFISTQAGAQTITTIAGNGIGAYEGDGAAATSARLWGPTDVWMDASENQYIADYHNNRIRKVTKSTGFISTIVGTGTGTVSGDGGAVALATLVSPTSITVESSTGDVYWAEYDHYVIRFYDVSAGIVDNVAGITSTLGNPTSGTVKGVAIGQSGGIAFDSNGDLFFSSATNQCIKKIVLATNEVSVYAGTCGFGGNAGDGASALDPAVRMHTPMGIAFDGSDNLYIAEWGGQIIRKVTKSTGFISTIAGNYFQAGTVGDGIAATDASVRLWSPKDLTVDGAGNVFFADQVSQIIRKIDGATGILTTVIGAGAPQGYTPPGDGVDPITAKLNNPWGICINPVTGDLVFADYDNQRVRSVDLLTTLPVELLYFKAELIDGNPVLQWETATEINSDRFEIERSYNGINWDKIGFVKGAGNSFSPTYYNETDYTANTGEELYYRLKQIDTDGRYSYSEIEVIDQNPPSDLIKLFPNPGQGILFLSLAGIKNRKVTCIISDNLGRALFEKKFQIDFSGQYFSFDISKLNPGQYYVSVKVREQLFYKQLIKRW